MTIYEMRGKPTPSSLVVDVVGVSASRADNWTSRVGCADSWSTSAFPRYDSALSFVSQPGDKTRKCARALETSAGERGEDRGKSASSSPLNRALTLTRMVWGMLSTEERRTHSASRRTRQADRSQYSIAALL